MTCAASTLLLLAGIASAVWLVCGAIRAALGKGMATRLRRRTDILPPADPRCERSAERAYMDSLKQWRT